MTSDPAAPQTGTAILRRTLRRHRSRLSGATALLSTHQAAETAVPIAIGLIVDYAIAVGDLPRLAFSLAGLGALFVVLSFAWRYGAQLLNVAYQRESHALRVEAARHILNPRGVSSSMATGEYITVSTSDADNEASILDAIPRGIAATVAIVFTAAVLVTIHVPLGLAVVIGTPVILAVLHAATPHLVRRTHAQQETVARTSAMATDLLSGLRPLRGVGGEAAASQRYRSASRRALEARISSATAQGAYTGASMTASSLLAVAVAAAAGWLALSGSLTVGQLIIVAGLAQFLLEPLSTLASVPGLIARARGSADRLALVLSAPPLLPAGERAALTPGALTVGEVKFRSLRSVSLTVAPGEFVVLFAYDPADGEALASVLSGQMAPSEYRGTVWINGVPIATAETNAARAVLLSEPHHTDLFAGSLRDNITLGRHSTNATNDVVLREALHASAADDVAELHRDGLDHIIGERGGTLSGGQRQRLALARALYVRPPILVLHDATTAVDAVTDQEIAQGVKAARSFTGQRLTTLVITTSPAFLSVADRVIVIKDGTVTSEGSHAVLITNDPAYRKAVAR
ncbi:ABC transporter ATP-binding protein [Hoyosella subflava]|uniref:Bifunctional ABC transporter n=1 Tax=Hoyosella subflava (strain DSM 45089 / JCM 17490 / NBRC 109087 / DQS3-9A1) TaxID=443218 RepID=F6EPS2_HOYSD|nr:ABC transporter ATP-binding protein [Hoyosella subflava]AEF40551.1 Bifunctional ABC transporter [Hoyosella subflava DQS3-9A1]